MELFVVFTPWWLSAIEFAVCNEAGQLSELQANLCTLKRDVDALRNITNLLLNYMLPHDIQSMTTDSTNTLHITALFANVPEKVCLVMTAIFLQLVEGSVQQLTSLRTCWAISNKESQTAVQMVWLHYSAKGCHNS